MLLFKTGLFNIVLGKWRLRRIRTVIKFIKQEDGIVYKETDAYFILMSSLCLKKCIVIRCAFLEPVRAEIGKQ